jgi:putative lipase involved disintegration of autophagic bodies
MRFIDNTGCESTSVYQLRENFLRAAYGKPSLQLKAGEISRTDIDNYVPDEKKLYAACINRPSYAEERYCTCFSRKAETVMTLKERKYFAEDFRRYYKDVQAKVSNENPPAQDRVWDLYKIFADCAT